MAAVKETVSLAVSGCSRPGTIGYFNYSNLVPVV